MAVGALVTSLDHRELGVGKVARTTADTVTIEYFDSVAEPMAYRVEVPTARVVTAHLDRQLRVYHRSTRGWRVGRVMEVEFGRVRVRPPGEADDAWLGVDEVYVRWDRLLEDPVGVMQARAMETPHYYFARRDFVDTMLEEDAASRGNRALTSSAIELYDHQIEVASRVLSDPVRRFLLADEVGMGKTIEAGLVIRQHLLDYPEAEVRVVAPERMCHQWTRELRDRFFVNDAVMSRVDVLAAHDLAAWAMSSDATPDLLVIDEAHHIAAWARGSTEACDRFAQVAQLAHSCPGLLLLSATPVAQNEAAFLAMLHLLDPDNYGLGELDEFRRRVENRHALARAFVLFRPGQTFRRMSRNADHLRDLLTGDDASIARLDALLAVGPQASRDDLDKRIRALRVAISDRHRIHYRMLRNRRDDAEDFPVRGRRLESVLAASATQAGDVAAWLDRWRNALVADAAASGHEWAPVARVMFDHVLAFPDVLSIAVRRRLGFDAAAPGTHLSSADEEAFAAYAPGPEEHEVLESWLDYEVADIADARVQAVLDYVWSVPRRRKVVVFANFTSTAIRIADALVDLLVEGQVVMHLQQSSIHDGEAALRQFRQERACNVLVCDASAEEGLNLQFADVVVHAELPGDPNRLEQRIGRLDRHGPDTPVDNIVIADKRAGSYLDAWIALLCDGFRVFDRSISSFQFVVDRLLPELITAFVQDGPAGYARLSETIPGRLDAERREIAEQDQLDAIEAIELARPAADGLRGLDDRWDELEAYHERLVCSGKGQLRFVRRAHYEDDALCSYWATDPQRGGEPLVPTRDLTAFMLGALSEPESVRWGSHNRAAVLGHPGTRLWAAGDPFLDGLLRYVRERDDRGRAYAFWKRQRDLEEGVTIAALRVDVIVEAGDVSGHGLSDEESSVLRRRAAGLLPPFVETVWVAPDLAEIVDSTTMRRLSGKYAPAFGDIHLHAGRWGAVEQALPGVNWETWCADARELADRIVRGRGSVTRLVDAACRAAESQGLARVEALRGRQHLTADSAVTLEFEERAAGVVRASVEHTRLVIDAMGLVILSRESPMGAP
jgi:ATP-dependent helicase HepA